MLSGTLLTKVTLQHILYPTGGNTYEQQTGGNTYEQQNQNLNQLPSHSNYFPNMVPDTKNEPVYGAKPRIGISAYDSGNSGELDSSINVL